MDTSRWSGEGAFTRTLIGSISSVGGVGFLRVEDAPASRVEGGYSFISNELYVAFQVRKRRERTRRLGIIPGIRWAEEKAIDISGLEAALSKLDEIGPPDYADEGMLQYLRTEQILPPYQTKGYKLVELVRIYEIGTEPRR